MNQSQTIPMDDKALAQLRQWVDECVAYIGDRPRVGPELDLRALIARLDAVTAERDALLNVVKATRDVQTTHERALEILRQYEGDYGN